MDQNIKRMNQNWQPYVRQGCGKVLAGSVIRHVYPEDSKQIHPKAIILPDQVVTHLHGISEKKSVRHNRDRTKRYQKDLKQNTNLGVSAQSTPILAYSGHSQLGKPSCLAVKEFNYAPIVLNIVQYVCILYLPGTFCHTHSKSM